MNDEEMKQRKRFFQCTTIARHFDAGSVVCTFGDYGKLAYKIATLLPIEVKFILVEVEICFLENAYLYMYWHSKPWGSITKYTVSLIHSLIVIFLLMKDEVHLHRKRQMLIPCRGWWYHWGTSHNFFCQLQVGNRKLDRARRVQDLLADQTLSWRNDQRNTELCAEIKTTTHMMSNDIAATVNDWR